MQVTVVDKSHLDTARSVPLQLDVGHVVPTPRGSPPRVTHSSADRELLIQRILETVRARRTIIPQHSQEREFMIRDTFPVGSITEVKASVPVLHPVGGVIPLLAGPWKRGPCFFCRQQGHVVNRCSRMDVSFPFLLPRWSAFQLWGALLLLKKNEVNVRFQIAAARWWQETRQWCQPRRWRWVEVKWFLFRCSVGVSQRQESPVGVLDVRGNSAIRPLSAAALEFSPTLGPQTGVTAGLVNVSSRAGIVAPAVVANFPVLAGVRFSAVAKVHASASEVDEDTLVVQASEQRSERHIDARKVAGVVNAPMAGASVSEPLEHSVLEKDLDGRPMEGVLLLEPIEHLVLDVSLDGGPIEGESDLEPLEPSALEEDKTGRPMEGDFGLEPLEHSVLDVNLDSRLRQDKLDSGPLGHSVPDHTSCGGAVLFDKLTLSDPLKHSGLITSDDVVPKSVPLEPLEHSVPEVPQSRGDGLVSEMDTPVQMRSVCLPRIASDTQRVDVPVWAECAGLSPELHCWRLQVGNLSMDTDGRLWKRRAPPSDGSMIHSLRDI